MLLHPAVKGPLDANFGLYNYPDSGVTTPQNGVYGAELVKGSTTTLGSNTISINNVATSTSTMGDGQPLPDTHPSDVRIAVTGSVSTDNVNNQHTAHDDLYAFADDVEEISRRLEEGSGSGSGEGLGASGEFATGEAQVVNQFNQNDIADVTAKTVDATLYYKQQAPARFHPQSATRMATRPSLQQVTGHFWAYATCEWITSCNDYDYVGTTCSAMLHGTLSYGYCFESSRGTLECGRMVGSNDEYNQTLKSSATASLRSLNPYNTQLPTIHRCPRGSPAYSSKLGGHLGKRLLVGGCMNSLDSGYDSLSEVHVPAMCTDDKTDYKKGCMFPGAENFDPTAKQIGKCVYRTIGCTDSNAFNYNSEATIPNPSECIIKKPGCTLRDYESIGANDNTLSGGSSSYWKYNEAGITNNGILTPNFQDLFVGMPIRGPKLDTATVNPNNYASYIDHTKVDYSGKIVFTGYAPATKYDPTANYMDDLHKCTPAIEGCTNPSSANYDSRANVNHNSWCLEVNRGCMIPFTGSAIANTQVYIGNQASSTGYANPSTAVNTGAGTITFNGGTVPLTARPTNPLTYSLEEGVNAANTAGIVGTTTYAAIDTNSGISARYRDGAAANFDPSVTVHVKSLCDIYHLGCTDTSAANYDVRATADDGSCFVSTYGCLNPDAKNFGCPGVCTGLGNAIAGSYYYPYENCEKAPLLGGTTTCIDQSPPVTNHLRSLCWFTLPNPPTPPQAECPNCGSKTVTEVKVNTVLNGPITDYCNTEETKLSTCLTVAIGGEDSGVSAEDMIVNLEDCNCEPGSTKVGVTGQATNAEAASKAVAAASSGNLKVNGQLALTSSGEVGETKTIFLYPNAPPPSSPPDDDDSKIAIIAGCAAAGGVVLIALAVGIYMKFIRKPKVQPSY